MKYFIRWAYGAEELPPGLSGNMSKIVIANDEASGLNYQTYYGMAGYKLKELKIAPYTEFFQTFFTQHLPGAADFYAGKPMSEGWLKDMVSLANHALTKHPKVVPKKPEKSLGDTLLNLIYPSAQAATNSNQQIHLPTLGEIAEKLYGTSSFWNILWGFVRFHKGAVDYSEDLVFPADLTPPAFDNRFADAWLPQQSHYVQEGDTLEKLATYYYGNSNLAFLLWAANPKLESTAIPKRAQVKIPWRLDGAHPFPPYKFRINKEQLYPTQNGETMGQISEKIYGTDSYWTLILMNNLDKIPGRRGNFQKDTPLSAEFGILRIPPFAPTYKKKYTDWTLGFYRILKRESTKEEKAQGYPAKRAQTIAEIAKLAYGSSEPHWVLLLLAANWDKVEEKYLEEGQWMVVPMESKEALKRNKAIQMSPSFQPGDSFIPITADPILNSEKFGVYQMGTYHINAVVQGIYGLYFESDPIKWSKAAQNKVKRVILELNKVEIGKDVWATPMPTELKSVKIPLGKATQEGNDVTQAVNQYLKEHLSGAHWVRKLNQSGHPAINDVNRLTDARFRAKFIKFLDMLQFNGCTWTIDTTMRDHTRALAMHWSWIIGKDGKDIPRGFEEVDYVYSGSRATAPNLRYERTHNQNVKLPVIWDHGLEAESRKHALAMVTTFRSQHRPAPNTRHFYGMAVDITIKNLNFGQLLRMKPEQAMQNQSRLNGLVTKINIAIQQSNFSATTIQPVSLTLPGVDNAEQWFLVSPDMLKPYGLNVFPTYFESTQQTLGWVLENPESETNIAYNSRLVWVAREFFDIEKFMDRTDPVHWQTTYEP